jgi:hypothetical protein
MAQDNTTDHIQITSSDPSGATIGTDILADSVHIQEIKINAGGDGVDGLMSNAYPVITRPSETYDIFYPVAGSTDGTDPVIVSVSGGITVEATIDGVTTVTADLRSVAAGITLAVTTIGQTNKVAVTGDVKLLPSSNNIGDVDVLTVSIPAGTGITVGAIVATSAAATTFPALQVETGFRITNFGPNTAILGPTMANNTALINNGYKLQQFDSLFIEATGPEDLFTICSSGETADLRVIGS